MGLKTSLLIVSDAAPGDVLKNLPQPDMEATKRLVAALFPNTQWKHTGKTSLLDTYPPKNIVNAGVFPRVSIIISDVFGGDYPSKLSQSFLRAFPEKQITLHTMHSVVDWFAFAVWKEGKLQRALSLAPDNGILEDIGEKPRLNNNSGQMNDLPALREKSTLCRFPHWKWATQR